MNPQTPSSKGPLIGTIVVLVLLVLGALYFVGPANKDMPQTPTSEVVTPVATTTPSDEEEISSINSDFSSLDVDAAGADIAQYEGQVTAE